MNINPKQVKNIINFIGSYPVESIPPPNGSTIKVITDNFNVYKVNYHLKRFVCIRGQMNKEEKVIAWKY